MESPGPTFRETENEECGGPRLRGPHSMATRITAISVNTKTPEKWGFDGNRRLEVTRTCQTLVLICTYKFRCHHSGIGLGNIKAGVRRDSPVGNS